MSSGLFELTKGVWTQITTTDKSGKVLHLTGDPSVVYMQSPIQPVGYDKTTPTSQSTIARNFFMYSEMATEDFLWAYSINSDAVISVTPSDGVYLNTDAPYFTGLRAMITQSYTEANSKLGVQYEVGIYNPSLGVSGISYFILKTGSSPLSLKGRRIEFDGLGLQSTVFESPTFTGGSPVQIFNVNHKNPITGEAIVLAAPSVTDEGTQVQAVKTYLGASLNGNQIQVESGQDAEGLEYIYKENTEYLFKLESIDTVDPQRVNSFATWYEGEFDLPLP